MRCWRIQGSRNGLPPAVKRWIQVSHFMALAHQTAPAAIEGAVLADPDDDHVIACALAAQADVIVSGNMHLLNLKHYQGMRIIDAAEALRALAQ